MKRSILILLLTIAMFQLNPCRSQNLVANPSFEAYSDTFCGIQMNSDFNEIMTDWVNPTLGSPQVFFTNISEACYNYQPESLYDGPIGIKGDQLPHTGEVMAGIYLYTIEGFNQRHYLQSALTDPMISGNTYVVEFYVSLGDYMEFSTDKIGAYLSTEPPSAINDGVLDYSPQVFADDFISDVANWVLISDTIVAAEDYSYLTIGNFHDDESTNTLSNPTSSGEPGTYGAFYFVDDVRIEELNNVGLNEGYEHGFNVFPTQVTDILNLTIPFESTVRLLNSHGQLVFSKPMLKGSETIDMSNFSKGIYFVSIQNEGETLTRRIVK